MAHPAPVPDPAEALRQLAEEAADFVEVSVPTPHGELQASLTPESFARLLLFLRAPINGIPNEPPPRPAEPHP